MKKIAFSIFLLFFAIPAHANPQNMTVEEQVIMKSFAGYVGGLVYDEVCNGTDPASRYDFEKPQNVMLMGNQQMLAARAGGVWKIRNPGGSVEDGLAFLLSVQERVEQHSKAVLEEKGCESPEAQSLARLYKLYSETHPGAVFAFIDKSIEDAGGTVTPLQEIEALDDN